MSEKPKRKRPTIDKSPIHLKSFGCATEMKFHNGGSIKIQMNSVEIGRLLDAVATFEIRSKRLPKYKILAAVEALKNGFDVLSGSEICITADVVIAQYAVKLEPRSMPLAEFEAEHERLKKIFMRADGLGQGKGSDLSI